MMNFRASADRASSSFLPWARIAFRLVQVVMALAVAGLYGQDLARANREGKYMDSKWVYAEVVSGLSVVTAIAFCLPFLKSWFFFAWDYILFILWVALFGVFGKMYIFEDAEGDSGILRMKHAVWVDCVNMILWFISATWGLVYFFTQRRQRTLHTSRAEI